MRHRSLPLALALAVYALTLLPAPRPALADPPIPDRVVVTCKPVESRIVFGRRFMVRCDKGWFHPTTNHEYPFFGIGTTNAAYVEQAMSTVHTAQISGKKVMVWVETSASSIPPGCQTDDCRGFVAISVVD
jgi:hypothetical protein